MKYDPYETVLCLIKVLLKRKKFEITNHDFLTDRLGEKRHGVQPTFHNTRLFLHFPKELCYGYLRFEGFSPFSSNLW